MPPENPLPYGALTGLSLVYAASLVTVGWWGVATTSYVSDVAVLVRSLLIEAVVSAGFLVIVHRLMMHRVVSPLTTTATRDALTGLLRPEVFWRVAEERVREAVQARRAIAFVIYDLDDFKKVNDTAGHLTGDAVLRAMGELLEQSCRAHDIVGRLGGEEFGWVLPGANEAAAGSAVARLLELCRMTSIESVAGWGFSAGIATWPGGDADPKTVWDLARVADRELYAAKASGKGQIRVS